MTLPMTSDSFRAHGLEDDHLREGEPERPSDRRGTANSELWGVNELDDLDSTVLKQIEQKVRNLELQRRIKVLARRGLRALSESLANTSNHPPEADSRETPDRDHLPGRFLSDTEIF
jgi:hypothetical protein